MESNPAMQLMNDVNKMTSRFLRIPNEAEKTLLENMYVGSLDIPKVIYNRVLPKEIIEIFSTYKESPQIQPQSQTLSGATDISSKT
jgi:hypothetical protein